MDEILGDDNKAKGYGGFDILSKTRETTKRASTKPANNSLGVGMISNVEWTFNNEAGSRSSNGAQGSHFKWGNTSSAQTFNKLQEKQPTKQNTLDKSRIEESYHDESQDDSIHVSSSSEARFPALNNYSTNQLKERKKLQAPSTQKDTSH